ncbi:Der1-like family-domain-containing protein [Tribonema minus]|uniref:Derlin n=1 Tax=Tribonema minus TaxID=303371 RepID=A0A835YYA5_9STRA|nr:Der1-like family-domain-containing protein [Tribonema minus]
MPPRGRIGAVGAAGSPEEWFKSLPPVSKVLITSLVGSTVLVMLGVIDAYNLALLWSPLRHKFEIWRLYTNAVFLGAPSFPFLMNLMIFGQYSIRYEKDAFDTGGGGGSADYAWMLAFGMAVLSGLSLAFFVVPFLSIPLMFMIIYVWSRKVPDVPTSFWGITVQSVYVPWVMVAFNLLTGASAFNPLLGIGVGHLYYFLVDVVPDQFGKDVLTTPAFLTDLFGYGGLNTGVQRFPAPGHAAPPRGFPRPGGGHTWGSGGRPLGTQ